MFRRVAVHEDLFESLVPLKRTERESLSYLAGNSGSRMAHSIASSIPPLFCAEGPPKSPHFMHSLMRLHIMAPIQPGIALVLCNKPHSCVQTQPLSWGKQTILRKNNDNVCLHKAVYLAPPWMYLASWRVLRALYA